MLSTVGIILGLTIIMSVVSRMCGGGVVNLPFGLDQHIYAIPYALAGWFLGGVWGAVVAYSFAFLGKRTGHGQYMDLGTWNKEVEPERVDFIVRWFFGKDTFDNPKRDFVGLCVTGGFVPLGLTLVAITTGNLVIALVALLGGLMKGISYLIGWKLPFGKPTETGEWLTGAFCGLTLGIVYVILLG
jgi:hypothetical protein